MLLCVLLHIQHCGLRVCHYFPITSFLGSDCLQFLFLRWKKLSRMILLSWASEALGYLKMAVTIVGPALDVTASLRVILACLAVCFTWLTHMRHAFLSFPLKVGLLAMRFFCCCFSFASSLFSRRIVCSICDSSRFPVPWLVGMGEGLVVKCGSTGGTVWSSPVHGDGCGC